MLNEREEKGVLKGEAKGKAEGKAEAILMLLARHGVPVSKKARACILACRDLAKLDRWLDKAITASSVDEVLSEP